VNAFILAWRMLGRDLRSGELAILLTALLIAVGSVSSVGFFADRVRLGLERESRQMLGADLLLISDHPWDQQWSALAGSSGLAQAEAITFPSMVQANGNAQLAEIKAVTPGYPLRGAMRTAPAVHVPDAAARGTPAPGSAWLDERMMSALGVKAGERIAIGRIEVRVDAVLTLEPDRGISFFALAPRVLMNRDDLEATGLIQTGSRVTYRLLIAGDDQAVAPFRVALEQKLERGQRIEDIQNARPEIRTGLDRAQRYLGLVALLAVMIAASAVALSARRFSERHVASCAVLRCLGASQGQLTQLFALEFALVGLGAALLGGALGYAAQFVLAGWLATLIQAALPQPSLLPALQGGIAGMLLLLGFALPPVLRLRKVSAIQVIRREWSLGEPVSLLSYAFGFGMLALLLVWQASDPKLGAIVASGFGLALGLFAALGSLLITVLSRVASGGGITWRYAIANLRRRRGSTLMQITALTVGLMALLLLGITRGELMASWQRAAPADAPNRFIVNIQPSQREAIAAILRQRGLGDPGIHPMVRGRLVAINDKPVNIAEYADDRAKRLVDREFNLSWASAVPEGNRVVAGRWFGDGPGAAPEFSVEEEITQTLNIRLGDRLTYEIAGQRVEAPVTSLRKLDWDSMRVNFFVIASPGLLERQPASYVTSFFLPAGRTAVVNELVNRFPNLTVIDVSVILRQVREVMDQMARAVQFVFLFTLAAGLLVLYAAINASRDERMFEAAVMRALGASSRQLLVSGLTEFCVVGAVAGLFAATGAAAVGMVLASAVFRLDYAPGIAVWGWGLAAGLLCGALGGWSGARIAVRSAPIQVLREAA